MLRSRGRSWRPAAHAADRSISPFDSRSPLRARKPPWSRPVSAAARRKQRGVRADSPRVRRAGCRVEAAAAADGSACTLSLAARRVAAASAHIIPMAQNRSVHMRQRLMVDTKAAQELYVAGERRQNRIRACHSSAPSDYQPAGRGGAASSRASHNRA